MPAVANFPSNFMFPQGLQTTNHRSQAITVKDQRPVIPADNIQLTL